MGRAGSRPAAALGRVSSEELAGVPSEYTPETVDEASKVSPDWRYNNLNILLPHQTENKRQGLRSIGKRNASAAISDQVLGVVADMLQNRGGGERLVDYRGHSLKPEFRHQSCPAQPCRRGGLHGLSVIIPVTNDYVLYVYQWTHASDYSCVQSDSNSQKQPKL